MEYENETWRLPLPKGKEKHIKGKPLQMSNPYAPLRHLTEQDDQDELNSSSDLHQARFKLQRKREREVSILHDVSHRHNRGLLEDLKAAGVETKHLQKYILAHRCKWCEANRGKRTYLVTTRQTEPAPLTISTIVDPIDPSITITEKLATSFKQAATEYMLRPLQDLLLTPSPLYVPSCLPPVTPDPTPYMDLRMDWADAASLGWDGVLCLLQGQQFCYFQDRTRRPLLRSLWTDKRRVGLGMQAARRAG